MTTTITRWDFDLDKPSISFYEYPELTEHRGFFFDKNVRHFIISATKIGKFEQSELNPNNYDIYLIGDKENSKQEFHRLIEEKYKQLKRLQKFLSKTKEM